MIYKRFLQMVCVWMIIVGFTNIVRAESFTTIRSVSPGGLSGGVLDGLHGGFPGGYPVDQKPPVCDITCSGGMSCSTSCQEGQQAVCECVDCNDGLCPNCTCR